MTNAQTEARAIQRYIAPSAGRGAVVQLLKHCDGEWVRYEDHAIAIAAKDAELSVQVEAKEHARRECERAEAALAEARKVLEPFSDMAGEMFARGWDASDVVIALDNPDEPHRVTAGDFFAARRALTGGQEDG